MVNLAAYCSELRKLELPIYLTANLIYPVVVPS